MTAGVDTARVLPFVAGLLEREGAAVEPVGEEALFVVLPEGLRAPLGLPAATTLDLSATPDARATPLALESAAMLWCLDRARGQGRRAGVRLACAAPGAVGRAQRVREALVLDNARCVDVQSTAPLATRTLLEFGYEAQGEERTDGRVYVAVTAQGAVSVPLAQAVLGALGGAAPEACTLDEADIGQAAARASATVEGEVRGQLVGFVREAQQRQDVERARIVAYHDRLSRESRTKRRRGLGAGETLSAKRAAIRAECDRRLADLAERHAIAVRFWLASALVVRYPVVACRVVLQRRRLESTALAEWDPVLGDVIGPVCAACGGHGLRVHLCDAEGHITCGTCASRCQACGRAPCRVCRPTGCGCPAAPA